MDTFGANTLPLSAPTNEEAVTDPGLTRIVQFFQAYVNAKAGTAWQSVKHQSLPVQGAFTHNPEEVSFNERPLPAMYLYRQQEDPFERLAEDYDLTHWNLRLLWIFPPVRQEFQKQRSTFVNGVAKVLVDAIETGQHPAYVFPGDPNPDARTEGSVIYKVAGIWSIDWKGCKVGLGVPIKMVENIDQRKYYHLDAKIELVERRQLDIVADFPPNARQGVEPNTTGGLDFSVTNADGTLVYNQAKT